MARAATDEYTQREAHPGLAARGTDGLRERLTQKVGVGPSYPLIFLGGLMPYNHDADKESMFCDRPCCMCYHTGPCYEDEEDDEDEDDEEEG